MERTKKQVSLLRALTEARLVGIPYLQVLEDIARQESRIDDGDCKDYFNGSLSSLYPMRSHLSSIIYELTESKEPESNSTLAYVMENASANGMTLLEKRNPLLSNAILRASYHKPILAVLRVGKQTQAVTINGDTTASLAVFLWLYEIFQDSLSVTITT